VADRIENLKNNAPVVDERENRPLRVENSKRQTEKWREIQGHVVFLFLLGAVN